MPSAARNSQSDALCLACGICPDRLEHWVHCQKLVSLVEACFPKLHRTQGPVLRWEFLALSLPLMTTTAIWEAVVAMDVLVYVQNAAFHGDRTDPVLIGKARLRF
jgi:hypothetical protein